MLQNMIGKIKEKTTNSGKHFKHKHDNKENNGFNIYETGKSIWQN